MALIVYDLLSIEDAQRGLEQLARDYQGSRDDYEYVRGALGSEAVARGVDDFTDDWKKRRDKQVAMIEEAAATLETIRTTYTELDNEGVRTLQSEET